MYQPPKTQTHTHTHKLTQRRLLCVRPHVPSFLNLNSARAQPEHAQSRCARMCFGRSRFCGLRECVYHYAAARATYTGGEGVDDADDNDCWWQPESPTYFQMLWCAQTHSSSASSAASRTHYTMRSGASRCGQIHPHNATARGAVLGQTARLAHWAVRRESAHAIIDHAYTLQRSHNAILIARTTAQ